jgi:hypothetical protein
VKYFLHFGCKYISLQTNFKKTSAVNKQSLWSIFHLKCISKEIFTYCQLKLNIGFWIYCVLVDIFWLLPYQDGVNKNLSLNLWASPQPIIKCQLVTLKWPIKNPIFSLKEIFFKGNINKGFKLILKIWAFIGIYKKDLE